MTGRLLIRAFPMLVMAAWVGLLIYFISAPEPNIIIEPSGTAFAWGHFITHLVLAVLIYLTVWQHDSTLAGRIRRAAITVIAATAAGVAFEAVQLFVPERDSQFSDIGYGAAGAVVGTLLVFVPDQLRVSRKLLLSLSALVVTGAIGLVGFSFVADSPDLSRLDDCRARLERLVTTTSNPDDVMQKLNRLQELEARQLSRLSRCK